MVILHQASNTLTHLICSLKVNWKSDLHFTFSINYSWMYSWSWHNLLFSSFYVLSSELKNFLWLQRRPCFPALQSEMKTEEAWGEGHWTSQRGNVLAGSDIILSRNRGNSKQSWMVPVGPPLYSLLFPIATFPVKAVSASRMWQNSWIHGCVDLGPQCSQK